MRLITRSSLTLPLLLTAIAVAVAWFAISPAAAFILLALALLEIAMAVDSSVPMAGLAARLHSPARRLFLSVGLVIGVLSMRLLLPPAAVAVAADESLAESTAEAVFEPGQFAMHLAAARPGIAAFGAVFIWLVFCEYLFNTERKQRRPWLGKAEAKLATAPRPRLLALATAVVIASTMTLLTPVADRLVVGVGSAIGLGCYLLVKVAASLLTRPGASGWQLHGYAATVVFERGLTVFMLFEILDGIYSLSAGDSPLGYLEQGAIAAFGVGIGAVFLARLTSRVDAGQGLTRLRHLRAGAAYVLGVLALLLWASLVVQIPAVVAGWFGTVIIGAALLSSLTWRRPRRLLTG